jgi:hypothetical protein
MAAMRSTVKPGLRPVGNLGLWGAPTRKIEIAYFVLSFKDQTPKATTANPVA